MLRIEVAKERDYKEIDQILSQLDLYHPQLQDQVFWVAREGDKIVGISCITDYDNFCFLSSVGVLFDHRFKGIATSLLGKISGQQKKDIYLYTITPQFFSRLGFQIISPPKTIPSRFDLDCENCTTEKCVCMVKRHA